jgi:hypothetical protein
MASHRLAAASLQTGPPIACSFTAGTRAAPVLSPGPERRPPSAVRASQFGPRHQRGLTAAPRLQRAVCRDAASRKAVECIRALAYEGKDP